MLAREPQSDGSGPDRDHPDDRLSPSRREILFAEIARPPSTRSPPGMASGVGDACSTTSRSPSRTSTVRRRSTTPCSRPSASAGERNASVRSDMGPRHERPRSSGSSSASAPRAATARHHRSGVSFEAPDRPSAEASHAVALRCGGRDAGRPGNAGQYTMPFFGACVLDLDGFKIEAVCRAAGDQRHRCVETWNVRPSRASVRPLAGDVPRRRVVADDDDPVREGRSPGEFVVHFAVPQPANGAVTPDDLRAWCPHCAGGGSAGIGRVVVVGGLPRPQAGSASSVGSGGEAPAPATA